MFVKEGSLRLGSNETLQGCSAINLSDGAVLDVSAVAGGYCLGIAGNQKLQGTGTIVGNSASDSSGLTISATVRAFSACRAIMS